jgi:hypothetical protein
MAKPNLSSKRIAPGAYDALVDALSVVFWNKAPFERFLRLSLREHPELLSGLTFGGLKRQVASDLVMQLASSEAKYQAVTLGLMLEVAAMDDFRISSSKQITRISSRQRTPRLRSFANGPPSTARSEKRRRSCAQIEKPKRRKACSVDLWRESSTS